MRRVIGMDLHRTFAEVGIVDAAYTAGVAAGPDWPHTPSLVRADGDNATYVVDDDGTRRHVVDPASFAAWGFSAADVDVRPAAEVDALNIHQANLRGLAAALGGALGGQSARLLDALGYGAFFMLSGALVIVVGVGFIATSVGVNYLFSRLPRSLFLIDAGYWIVMYLVMGAIFGVMV